MRIFGKQMLLYLGVLVISFALLGTVLVQGIRNFFVNHHIDQLSGSAARLAQSVGPHVALGVVNWWALETEMMNVYRYLGASVAITLAPYHDALAVSDETLPFGVLAHATEAQRALLAGGYAVALRLGAGYQVAEPLLMVGHPIMVGEDIWGAAWVAVSMAELDAAMVGMYRVIVLGMVSSALVATLLIYLSSRAISRPIKQINEAARVIAGGDLEKRLPVKGRDEVGQLATQFNRMAESLQSQDTIRRTFIANLSHDIRSPLTSMRGFLQAIADGTAPPEQHPYYLQIITDETQRLIKLSNDLLDIDQLQHGAERVNRTVFDINDLIRKTALGFEQRAIEKQLTVTSRFAHATDPVWADADMIQRVLYNLIDNACKFTDTGGTIDIETTVTAKQVTVSVADNGRGMTPEEQQQVFERFYKGDATRNLDKMGSGLGLSIVRSFIHAHGETITLESTPERGTQLAFTLPVGVV